MPSRAFSLTVPAAAPFRGLTADAVRAYLCRMGDEDAIEAFAAQVGDATDRLATHGDVVDLEAIAGPDAFEVRLSCGGRTETLTHPAVERR